jgi:hypothetical protein
MVGDGVVEARFDVPVRAVTPGQAAVFYRADEVVGGGWIARPLRGAVMRSDDEARHGDARSAGA